MTGTTRAVSTQSLVQDSIEVYFCCSACQEEDAFECHPLLQDGSLQLDASDFVYERTGIYDVYW